MNFLQRVQVLFTLAYHLVMNFVMRHRPFLIRLTVGMIVFVVFLGCLYGF